MPNVNVSKEEMSFLSIELLKTYCLEINSDFATFSKKLTGTITIYEDISASIKNELKKTNRIENYGNKISNGAHKRLITKWKNSENDINKLITEFVSENRLRKLIFYGRNADKISFGENFILFCYAYIELDRHESQLLNKKIPNSSLNTIMPSTKEKTEPEQKKTIHPNEVKTNRFKLRPLSHNDGFQDKTLASINFRGSHILLNRENLDPKNMTITSKIQAIIKIEDGEWVLENQSALNTTYIQVHRPTKLRKGDIILFGDKQFIFEC